MYEAKTYKSVELFLLSPAILLLMLPIFYDVDFLAAFGCTGNGDCGYIATLDVRVAYIVIVEVAVVAVVEVVVVAVAIATAVVVHVVVVCVVVAAVSV